MWIEHALTSRTHTMYVLLPPYGSDISVAEILCLIWDMSSCMFKAFFSTIFSLFLMRNLETLYFVYVYSLLSVLSLYIHSDVWFCARLVWFIKPLSYYIRKWLYNILAELINKWDWSRVGIDKNSYESYLDSRCSLSNEDVSKWQSTLTNQKKIIEKLEKYIFTR